MLMIASDMKIVIATSPVDMRRSIDGLTLAVIEDLSADPQSKHLYVFHNKRRDKVKLLYWDKNGFCLLYKRLERGLFRFPRQFDTSPIEIDEQQLSWLLAGFDFMRMADYPELDFSDYF